VINQWFPNVTDLSILFEVSYPRKSLPCVLDLTKVTTLSLDLAVCTVLTPSELSCIIHLFEQTCSLHSLAVIGESFIKRQPSNVEQINSIISRYVNGSKFRQLKVPVCKFHHVQTLLNRFRHLISVQFRFNTDLLTCDELIAFVKASIPDCSILNLACTVSIWIDERIEKTKNSKRPASCFRSFRQSLKSPVQ
jgi:hypothetical protein